MAEESHAFSRSWPFSMAFLAAVRFVDQIWPLGAAFMKTFKDIEDVTFLGISHVRQ